MCVLYSFGFASSSCLLKLLPKYISIISLLFDFFLCLSCLWSLLSHLLFDLCVFWPTETVCAIFFITSLVNGSILFKQVYRLTHKTQSVLHSYAEFDNGWGIQTAPDYVQQCQSSWHRHSMNGLLKNLADKLKALGFVCGFYHISVMLSGKL